MFLYVIIAVAVITTLFLIYRQLNKLAKTVEDNFNIINAKWDEQLLWPHKFSEQLKAIQSKITELSDISTIDNPAWGTDSASERKKDKLIRSYAEHLVQEEKMSYEDALCKALFAVNNCNPESIIKDMIEKTQYEAKVKSEEDLRSAAFFRKEVEEKTKNLKPIDVFRPLYLGIMKKNYGKGESLSQRSLDSYGGNYGYERFLEDAAIIYKLEELGLFKKDTKWGRKYTYILTETDPTELRRVIFGNIEDSKSLDDFYSAYKYLYGGDGNNIKLPFTRGGAEP